MTVKVRAYSDDPENKGELVVTYDDLMDAVNGFSIYMELISREWLG